MTKNHDHVEELNKITGQGWSAFCKLDNIMRQKNAPMRLKAEDFNDCILSIMTYHCKTWSLSKHPSSEAGHKPKEDREKYGRSHPQRQKEYKLDPELYRCYRHYQECKRKKTQMDGYVASRRDNRWIIRVSQ